MVETIVVGSGYGGSVMAARLAARGEVLLLERGRDWEPAEIPQSLGGLVRSYRTERLNPLGFWEMRFGRGTGNAFASALGGASLVNYGLTVRPDPHVFETWPVSSREMAVHYERALQVLRPSPAPVGDQLADKPFLDRVEPGRRVDVENTIDWDKCTSCGHCIPGCREGAKRSLTRTYLPLAREDGVRIRTETEVVGFQPNRGGGYRLQVRKTGSSGRPEELTCRRLILSAGTFGTLDLLHRVRRAFPLSPSFGRHLSMNGDALAFLYNTPHELSGYHGAPITTSVRIRFLDSQERPRSLLVMSGRVPMSMMRITGLLLACLSDLLGRTVGPVRDESILRRLRRRLRDLWSVREGGALSQSFMYKIDAQDSMAGVARFTRSGRALVDWPGYPQDPILRQAAARLEQWGRTVGGTVVLLPGLRRAMKGFSVHTLGGCCMASSPDEGVVNPEFQVYRPGGGTYSGLHIVDASVIPTSLGVPPSLTIAALAERAAEAILANSSS